MRVRTLPSTAPLKQAHDDVQPRVVPGAGRQRPRVGVVGVYVVAVDGPGARPGGCAEQELNGTVVAREFAPACGAVDGGVCHGVSPTRYVTGCPGGHHAFRHGMPGRG